MIVEQNERVKVRGNVSVCVCMEVNIMPDCRRGERVSPMPVLAAEHLRLRRESGMNRVSLWTSAYDRKGQNGVPAGRASKQR